MEKEHPYDASPHIILRLKENNIIPILTLWQEFNLMIENIIADFFEDTGINICLQVSLEKSMPNRSCNMEKITLSIESYHRREIKHSSYGSETGSPTLFHSLKSWTMKLRFF